MGTRIKDAEIFSIRIPKTEFIFDENECAEILKFFFDNQHAYIDQLEFNYQIIAFSHALLVFAIEWSYRFGYIDVIYNNFFMQPPKGLRGVLSKFGKDAMAHWFKNPSLRKHLFLNICIYEKIRQAINWRFNTSSRGGLEYTIMRIQEEKPFVIFIQEERPIRNKPLPVWRN